jgi:ubiquitin C-terminal hydrolase
LNQNFQNEQIKLNENNKKKLEEKYKEIEEKNKEKDITKKTFIIEKKILLEKIDKLKNKINYAIDILSLQTNENDNNNCNNDNNLIKENDINFSKNNIENFSVVGINNEELNCYMSSVIQILKNISIFSDNLLNTECDDNIIESFKNLLNLLLNSNKKSVSLLNFKKNFSKKYKTFEGRKENDSTLFLIYLLNYLHKNLKINENYIKKDFKFLDLENEEYNQLTKFIYSYELKNNSFIYNLFYGYEMFKIICSSCNYSQVSFQCFNILDIPLMEGNNKLNSLIECINTFLYSKDQKDVKGFECIKCDNTSVSHSTSIIYFPQIFVINLKRVGEKKIYNHVIDIPFILETKKIDKLKKFKKKYELIGFINHYGSQRGGGHNIAYSKNKSNNKWYEYNDSSVIEIKNPSTDKAFLLFYYKIDEQ